MSLPVTSQSLALAGLVRQRGRPILAALLLLGPLPRPRMPPPAATLRTGGDDERDTIGFPSAGTAGSIAGPALSPQVPITSPRLQLRSLSFVPSVRGGASVMSFPFLVF
jgi:hypothetical protein